MPRFHYLLLAILIGQGLVRAENWPWWRGPSRQGISAETGVPTEWNTDSHVLWKSPVPGEAWSSPIVFGNDVYLTTTTDAGVKCHVLCLDARTGEVRWSREVFTQVPLRKEGRNSYATATPATDGNSVFAVFGDGSVAALSARDGAVLWTYRGVDFYSQHGLGASPVLHGDLLIMPYDGSSRGTDKGVGWQVPWDQSYILALDKSSGQVRWKARRGQSRIAHVTPNVMEHRGREILVSGAGDVVQGFNLETGDRLWSVTSPGEGVVPSIVVGNGLVFSASGYGQPTIRAVKLPASIEGQAEVAWEQRKGVPAIPSFIFWKDHLYTITDGGIASCLKARTGEIVWQERVGGNFSSSPVLAEERIYFTSENAETTVIEAAPVFKVLARNSLNEKCQSSMAISGQRIFLRTEQNLFCIGVAPTEQ